ncbi:MAG TPA: STAS domain-containing protein [Acidimicrobiia bacterium]|nr:STAS domain-containing protein [Acidimicrobiia bacterium]
MSNETFRIVRDTTVRSVRFEAVGELDMAHTQQVADALGVIDDDIVVDCSQLSFLDSAGIGALVAQHARLQGAGHRVTLVNLEGQPRRTLAISGLLEAFLE